MALGRDPNFLFDNDEKKWGQRYFGLRCLSKNEFLSLSKDAKLILTTRLANRFSQQLKESGFSNTYAVSFERCESRVRGIIKIENKKYQKEKISPQLRNLRGNWCYISGASRGIGAFIAETLANYGVNLVVQARSYKSLSKVTKKLKAKNIEVIECEAEFDNVDSLNNHCNWIRKDCPELDLFFLNAGISPQPEVGSFIDGSIAGWINTYQVNVIAPWKIIQSSTEANKIKKHGRVIFMSSSISARINESAYACSKAALTKLAFDLSKNHNSLNVEFCVMDPGWVSTDMGGKNAPSQLESLFPGIVVPILSKKSCNGSWISVQDYYGFSDEEAIWHAYCLGDLKEQ